MAVAGTRKACLARTMDLGYLSKEQVISRGNGTDSRGNDIMHEPPVSRCY